MHEKGERERENLILLAFLRAAYFYFVLLFLCHFPSQVSDLKRGDVERELKFVGFVAVACPLRKDSKECIRELKESSHHVSKTPTLNKLGCRYMVKHQYQCWWPLTLTYFSNNCDSTIAKFFLQFCSFFQLFPCFF